MGVSGELAHGPLFRLGRPAPMWTDICAVAARRGERDGLSVSACWDGRRGGGFYAVASQHALGLQYVVCQSVPEHDGAHLGLASHVEADQVPVAPAGMNAFADRSSAVLQLAFLAGHPASPGEHARTVAGSRLAGIAAML